MKSFQKGPPPEKAKLKRWWRYLSQFRLIVHHISAKKNELSDYILRNNVDALTGESSEALAKEDSVRMDVQLDFFRQCIDSCLTLTEPRTHIEPIVDGGYDSCPVVTCVLSGFSRVFPCSKKIAGDQTVKMLIEQ